MKLVIKIYSTAAAMGVFMATLSLSACGSASSNSVTSNVPESFVGSNTTGKTSNDSTAVSYEQADNLPSPTQQFKRYKAVAVETLPHDKHFYTQGLFFYNGTLYESNGQYGQSTLRTIDLKSGKTIKKTNFDSKYFAEGSCVVDNNLFVLTWQEQTCFVFDPKTLDKIGEIKYNGQGWGLTTNGKELIMSNGSSEIFFLDPLTFTQKKTIKVNHDGKEIGYINELEYINGLIWANVYGEDYIIAINPDNGEVTSMIDCTDIYPTNVRSRSADVLNGIAYNPATQSVYITGKLWPNMYKIELK